MLATIISITFFNKGGRDAAYCGGFAYEEACEINDVCAEVTKRARASRCRIQAPDHTKVGVDNPFLEVLSTEMEDASQATSLDDITSQADCGHEAIVEGTHMHNTC